MPFAPPPSIIALQDLFNRAVQSAPAPAQAAPKVRVKPAPGKADAASSPVDDIILGWRTTALVLLMEEWQCRCGARGQNPQGLFLHQEHPRLPFSIRLLVVPHEPEEAYPRRVRVETHPVPICGVCASGLGFAETLEAPGRISGRLMASQHPGEYVADWLDKRRQSAPAGITGEGS